MIQKHFCLYQHKKAEKIKPKQPQTKPRKVTSFTKKRSNNKTNMLFLKQQNTTFLVSPAKNNTLFITRQSKGRLKVVLRTHF